MFIVEMIERIKFYMCKDYYTSYSDLVHESDKYFNDLLYPDVQDVTMHLGIIHAIVKPLNRVKFIDGCGNVLPDVVSEVFNENDLWGMSVGVIRENGSRMIIPHRLFNFKTIYKKDKVYFIANPKYYKYRNARNLKAVVAYDMYVKY